MMFWGRIQQFLQKGVMPHKFVEAFNEHMD